jgi:MFS family permease
MQPSLNQGAPARPLYPATAAPRIAAGPRMLFASPGYLRLWTAGAIGNGMRWLEFLVAGIFTWQATHSSLVVASMMVCRTLPMLFFGTVAGVVAEAFDRRKLLLLQLSTTMTISSSLAVLAGFGALRIWQLAVAGAIGGVAWTQELAVRRRMIGECVPLGQVSAAIAFDTLTASITRVLGPLLGGAIFQTIGLGGAYTIAAVLYGLAGAAILGLVFEQERRPLRLRHIPADIAEGIAAARANPTILMVVLVSVIANSFGFTYSSLIAPLGLHRYGVSPLLVGLLAAAEAIGATIVGIGLSAGWVRLGGRQAMLRGTFLFFAGVIVMALSPWYALAFIVLCIAGFGTAAFSIMQTTLILTEAPAAVRSRVMGIVTVCIGTGPFGALAIGALASAVGEPKAILTMALTGLALLCVVGWRLSAARR